MKKTYYIIFFGIICLYLVWKVNFIEKSEMRVLSRSKRSLVFPEGSSFQLVFCVQTSAIIPIGDIFLYGNTAALAWNLPTDPKHLLMLKNKNAREQEEQQDDEMSQNTYKRSDTDSPTFTKRSADRDMSFKEKLKIKIDRAKMHNEKRKRDFLKKDHLDHESLEFHRISRVGLYEKLEPLITTLGGDGRHCVLYKLCESAKTSEQGTFLQEFLRVIFTLPKGRQLQKNHIIYDKTHTPSDDCATLYPDCDLNLPLQTINK